MKNKQLIYFVLVVIAVSLFSCNKEGEKVIISSNPVPPVILIPANGTDIVMTSAQSQDSMMFIWKSPDYGFKASVLYRVQFDTSTSFSARKFLNVAYNDTFLVQTAYLNTFLISSFKLDKNKKYSLDVRLRAMTDALTDTIYSDPIKLNVTTY